MEREGVRRVMRRESDSFAVVVVLQKWVGAASRPAACASSDALSRIVAPKKSGPTLGSEQCAAVTTRCSSQPSVSSFIRSM